MKLKKLLKSTILSDILAQLLRIYLAFVFITSRIEFKIEPKSLEIIRGKECCIVSMWHSRILIFPKLKSYFGQFSAVISTHQDASLVESTLKIYGHKAVRGSSRKQPVHAMLGVMRILKNGGRIVVTPDGPKGPRFAINGNLANLAYQFKIPIISMCYSASRVKIFNTWDLFLLPFPFNKLQIEVGPPIYINEADNADAYLQSIMIAQVENLDKAMGIYEQLEKAAYKRNSK
jgi:lysophospholipid acyltransferase (LPLAT)-like uncharacterized protein